MLNRSRIEDEQMADCREERSENNACPQSKGDVSLGDMSTRCSS